MTLLQRVFLLSLVSHSALAALITNLPGSPAVNFKQYSGYYTVGTTKNHQLHYWFVESQGNPSTDPLLVWLTGGPGCSGLSALLTEWGPLMVNPDGATLWVNPYSWNKNASILTLEAPAGVGYSFATDGNVKTGDDQVPVT
ncbi:serine carboxypeptidase [Cooperia oncophora]